MLELGQEKLLLYIYVQKVKETEIWNRKDPNHNLRDENYKNWDKNIIDENNTKFNIAE